MQNKETRGSADAKRWASDRAGEFGAAVKHWREERDLSALALSKRTEEIGYPITRGTLAKIEGNHRAGKVDVAEVVTLAEALGVPPIELICPGAPDAQIEMLPGRPCSSFRAAQWISGETANDSLIGLARQRAELKRKIKLNEKALQYGGGNAEELVDWIEKYRDQIETLDRQIVVAGGVVDGG